MARLPFLRLLSLAARQLLRDARAGELRVLFFALVVAVAASTAIGYFGARLNGAMMLRATEFLGADLILEGSSPARPEQIEAGEKLKLDHARIVLFSSVIATDSGIQLSSIKAVDDAYPLRGDLKSAPDLYQPEQIGNGPEPGEAWVEARLLPAVNLKVGDSIDVGSRTLKLTRILTYEPDRAGNFYSLTPRVMINLQDLAATGVVQPGSRVEYREMWSGPPEVLAAYRKAIEPGLEPHQEIKDARDGSQQIGGALGKAERYLNMASLVAVLLAGVAVALSASRFAARRFDSSALPGSVPQRNHDPVQPATGNHWPDGQLERCPAGLAGTVGAVCPAAKPVANNRPRWRLAARSRRDRHRSGCSGRFCPAATGRPGPRTAIACLAT